EPRRTRSAADRNPDVVPAGLPLDSVPRDLHHPARRYVHPHAALSHRPRVPRHRRGARDFPGDDSRHGHQEVGEVPPSRLVQRNYEMTFEQRSARAALLASQHEAAREVLEFAAKLCAAQASVWRTAALGRPDSGGPLSSTLDQVVTVSRPILEVIAERSEE